MNGDGLRTCAPVKSIKTSQQVFIGFKNLPTGYYRKLKTSGQSMCSNGRLAIETSIKNLVVNTISSEPHHQFLLPSHDQFTCLFFVSLASHLFVFPFVLFHTVSSHCFFPSVSHPSSHPLAPVSTAPPPPIPIYPRSCVVCFVYLPEDQPRP